MHSFIHSFIHSFVHTFIHSVSFYTVGLYAQTNVTRQNRSYLRPVHTSFRNRRLCIRKQAILLPFQATLCPETDDFVAENGHKVACFGIQSRLFPHTKLPFLATKSPVSGFKVARFRRQSRLFRKQVWTGHYSMFITLTAKKLCRIGLNRLQFNTPNPD